MRVTIIDQATISSHLSSLLLFFCFVEDGRSFGEREEDLEEVGKIVQPREEDLEKKKLERVIVVNTSSPGVQSQPPRYLVIPD